MGSNSTSKAEQARLLGEYLDAVKVQAGLMRRAIEKNDLKEVLKHAAVMLGELRTSLLTPKSYYELYMNIFDYLGTLENYFTTTVKNGTPALEIYEAVQHAGNVLPRLYLMITAGSVYIRSGQSTPKIICTDLIEYIKGVQHPQRGLFVRYYLIQRMKDKLPEDETDNSVVSSSSSSSSASREAINFLTTNLIEMNRLWVRMQTPSGGIVRNRKRRERERLELRILVGANLTRLANVSHLDLFVYKTDILPKVTTEIIDCKDKIAQAYLFESLLQVFPLDLHLRTLDTLLGILPKLVSDHLTIKTVALALLARITEGATLHGEDSSHGKHSIPAPSSIGLPSPTTVNGNLPSDIDVFGIILSFISNLAADTEGPFRPTPAGTGGGKKEKNKDDSDDDGPAPGTGNNPVTVSPTKPVRVPSSSTNKLAALREAGDAAAAAQPLASLLGIFSSLEAFSIALYPKHQPYIDAVLGATAKALRDALGLSPTQDPNSLVSMDYTPVTQSLSASIPEAAVALEHLLTPTEGSSSSSNTVTRTDSIAVAAPAIPSSSSSNTVSLPSASPLDETCSKLVVSILEAAQVAFELDVLQLSNYGTLLSVLPYRYKREVAAQLCQTILDGSVSHALRVRTVDVTRRLYHSLQPLIRDEDATPSDLLHDTEERKQFTLQQENMALLSTLLGPITSSLTTIEDCTTKYKIFLIARDFLSWGGPRRISVTYPALLSEILQLATTVRTIDSVSTEGTALLKNIFELIHDICFTLSIADHNELSLSMFLKAALHCQDSTFAYEFFSQAFLIYEVITDSRKQYTNLQHIINALHSSTILENDAYHTLVTRCTQLSTRLLRKADQVRTLVSVSNLFWHGKLSGTGEYRKAKELIACLQRALRIADTTLPPNPSLFIDILNSYVTHYENKVTGITLQQIHDLVTLAQQHVEHASIVNAAASSFLLQQSKRRLIQSVTPSTGTESHSHHHSSSSNKDHHHSHATSNDSTSTIHPNEIDIPKYLETTLQKVNQVTKGGSIGSSSSSSSSSSRSSTATVSLTTTDNGLDI